MDRWSGWVEIRAYDRSGAPADRVSARVVARVRDLVENECPLGSRVRLTRGHGRVLVWLDGPSLGTGPAGVPRPAVVPFLKSLGCAAPASYGVLEVVSATGTVTRWRMARGSVTLAEVVPSVRA